MYKLIIAISIILVAFFHNPIISLFLGLLVGFIIKDSFKEFILNDGDIVEARELGDEIKNLLKGIKPKRDDDLSDDADKPSDNAQKSPTNKGPLPSFTKDQNFPLPN